MLLISRVSVSKCVSAAYVSAFKSGLHLCLHHRRLQLFACERDKMIHAPGVCDICVNTHEQEWRCVLAEMPHNATATVKRNRLKQHASLSHLTEVIGTRNDPDRASLDASAAGSRKAEPGPAPAPCMQLAGELQGHPPDVAAAGSPSQPRLSRQRSPPLPIARLLQKRPRSGLTLPRVSSCVWYSVDGSPSSDWFCEWHAVEVQQPIRQKITWVMSHCSSGSRTCPTWQWVPSF